MATVKQPKTRPVGDRIKLTDHVFGYKKMVMGEVLYFGYSEPVAQSRAMRVMALATELKTQGLKRWTASALVLAKAIAKGQETPASVASQAEAIAPPSVHPPTSPQPPALAPPPAPKEVQPPAPPIVMLHDAIDAYASDLKASGAKSKDHCFRGRIFAQKRAIANKPLSKVGERELVGLVNFWKSKPTGTRCVYDGATRGWKVIDTGKPLAAQTVKLNIGTARQLFRWLSSSASGFDWCSPNLQPIFELKNADVERLRTPAEKMLEVRARNDEDAQHFTIDELAKLWNAASNSKRQLFFLLSLNAGCATSELASLLVGHCFLDGKHAEKTFVAFVRPKTGVYGKWFLWSETRDELKDYLEPKYPYDWITEEVEGNLRKYVVKNRVYQPTGSTCPSSIWDTELTLAEWRKARVAERQSWEKHNAKADPSEHVFLTDEGNPLITKSESGNRNDAVKLVWGRWSEAAGVSRLSWKNMRKTGSQLVRRAATDIGLNGDYMSELFLAHQAPVMSRPYNRRDDGEYEQLGRVLAEVRKRLASVFGDTDEHE